MATGAGAASVPVRSSHPGAPPRRSGGRATGTPFHGDVGGESGTGCVFRPVAAPGRGTGRGCIPAQRRRKGHGRGLPSCRSSWKGHAEGLHSGPRMAEGPRGGASIRSQLAEGARGRAAAQRRRKGQRRGLPSRSGGGRGNPAERRVHRPRSDPTEVQGAQSASGSMPSARSLAASFSARWVASRSEVSASRRASVSC